MAGKLLNDISIYLPSCTLSNEPDLLKATIKVGYIARYLAIYRVNKVYIYEPSQYNTCKDQAIILSTLLEYARTPPYLKKRVFPKRRELRYAGLIPPLQIPTHIVSPVPVPGEYREGYITRVDKNRVLIDIGLPKLVEIELDKSEDYTKKNELGKILDRGESNRLVIIRVESTDPLEVSIVSKPEIYTGYRVFSTGFLPEVISGMKGRTYVIGTSRKGRPIWKSTGSFLNGVLKYKGSLSIFFGEPYRGLYEILQQDHGIDADSVFDDIFNFVPEQGTKSIRTEEALPAVLQTIRILEQQYG